MNSVLYGRHAPLIVLTVATQTAVGLSLFRALHQLIPGADLAGFLELFTIFMLTVTGAVVSVFHLGHPARIHTALKNPRQSWLSREGIFLSLFVATTFLQMVSGAHHTLWPSILLAFLGLALLFVQAMIYVVPGYSAMGNGAPVLLFLFSCLTIGISLTGWFGGGEWRASLVQPARIVFSAGLLAAVILPWLWRLGNAVVSDTAAAWIRSPFYYLWMVPGFALPILILTVSDHVPVWLPVLVIPAECMGRVLFFNETRHASDYIGKL